MTTRNGLGLSPVRQASDVKASSNDAPLQSSTNSQLPSKKETALHADARSKDTDSQ